MYKRRNKRRMRRGTLLFLIFFIIIMIFMLWVSEQYLRNSAELLERTSWIEEMEGKR